MPPSVKSCPNCRAKVDPTFTTHCPECGTSLSPDVASMAVPGPTPIPPGKAGLSRFLRGVVLRVAVAGAVLAAGAGWAAFTQAGRSESGEVIDAGLLDAFALAVGDCIDWPSIEDVYEFGEVTAIPCEKPHDAEVYALASYPLAPGTGYPGDDVVGDWSVDACYQAFSGYIGRTYEEAEELDFTFFTPTEAGWNSQDDRVVQCVVFRVDEARMSGTVRSGA
jgi:hypothetical protein